MTSERGAFKLIRERDEAIARAEAADARAAQLQQERDACARRRAALSERLYTLRASLTALAATWQPIETAPKDGTPVLVTAGNVVGEARYYADSGSDTGWWWANETPGDYHAEKIMFHHGEPHAWQPMPLPAPPTRADELDAATSLLAKSTETK